MSGIRLTVVAKPGAREPSLRWDGKALVVAVREHAVDGRANRAIVRAIAAWLHVPPSAVAIERGTGTRTKRVAVEGRTADELTRALEQIG